MELISSPSNEVSYLKNQFKLIKMKKSILLFCVIATLSSCVYSLFPIYTDDTLVFKEDLLGKWATNEDGSEYLLFESTNDKKEDEAEENQQKYSIEIREGFTMSSDDPISMVINGDTIYDDVIIKEEMLRRLAKIESPEKQQESIADKVVEKVKSSFKDKEYNGTVAVYDTEKSYKLKAVSNKGEQNYIAHLVDIGGDLFMDTYPVADYSSSNFTDNFFPVHSFFKITIKENEFILTHFDLDKLNKLFESNLIRLRHENVDGTILITAQPKELQKFIDKYSDDESVFDYSESYAKITP